MAMSIMDIRIDVLGQLVWIDRFIVLPALRQLGSESSEQLKGVIGGCHRNCC